MYLHSVGLTQPLSGGISIFDIHKYSDTLKLSLDDSDVYTNIRVSINDIQTYLVKKVVLNSVKIQLLQIQLFSCCWSYHRFKQKCF